MTVTMMRRLRLYHHYLGVLFAPAILFFAFSGALQTFDFHETRGGATPPGWIKVIASLHKKQALPRPKPARPTVPATAGDARGQGQRDAARPAYPLALKIFVGLMSVGLMLSTLIGLTVALANARMRARSLLLLAVGTALPVVLLIA